jgi:hypothetical protein
MALYTDYDTAPAVEDSRSSEKNRYTVYPVVEGGVEGYADFIERTLKTTYRTNALTLGACQDEMDVIELLAYFEADDKNTSGSYSQDDVITGSHTFYKTITTVETKMDGWTAGTPPST